MQLGYNRIEAMAKGTFIWLHTISILVMNNNNIRTIHFTLFLGLGKLIRLVLRRNCLQTCCTCFLVWDSLSSLEGLEHLKNTRLPGKDHNLSWFEKRASATTSRLLSILLMGHLWGNHL